MLRETRPKDVGQAAGATNKFIQAARVAAHASKEAAKTKASAVVDFAANTLKAVDASEIGSTVKNVASTFKSAAEVLKHSKAISTASKLIVKFGKALGKKVPLIQMGLGTYNIARGVESSIDGKHDVAKKKIVKGSLDVVAGAAALGAAAVASAPVAAGLIAISGAATVGKLAYDHLAK